MTAIPESMFNGSYFQRVKPNAPKKVKKEVVEEPVETEIVEVEVEEVEPVEVSADEFEALKEKGWTKMSGEERKRYKELKPE